MKELVLDAATPLPNNMSKVQRPVFAHYSLVEPQISNPKLILSSSSAAKLVEGHISSEGKFLITNDNHPWAWNYAGHQFGVWAGQLGDGRAISIGQLVNSMGDPWEVQLKGAGLTPFSRGADGYAVLRSSIREFLASEAMNAYGIPTTRALSLIGTDSNVIREEVETGAVVIRLANTWVRFGNFELFYSRGDIDGLKLLADYTMKHFFPPNINTYLDFLETVIEKTAFMIAKWQAIGFCHGVMNTDNFSILGLTLDYGPYQFLDQYDPAYICNKSDDFGRYSFEKQPDIGFWNCMRLGVALSPLIKGNHDSETEIQQKLLSALKKYPDHYVSYYKMEMMEKLGLYKNIDTDMTDLVYPLLNILEQLKIDYTLFFRYICSFSDAELREPLLEKISSDLVTAWIQKYKQRLLKEDLNPEERTKRMLLKNPLVIPRNHHLLHCIEKAKLEDFEPLNDYWKVLQEPYSSRWINTLWSQEPSPEDSGLKCSCSS